MNDKGKFQFVTQMADRTKATEYDANAFLFLLGSPCQ